MAINTQLINNSYVKFVRTTLDKWNLLTNKDTDTLYFVISEDNSKGSLYLGTALIANNLNAGMSLSQLNDFIQSGALTKDDVLVYSGGRWTNKQISSFMPVTMKGATDSEDGEGGLVPMPVAGENDLYLRGDGQWADPTGAVAADVAQLQTDVTNLDTRLSAVISSDINKSMRSVATEVAAAKIAEVVAGAPETFDTLKEIAEWIQGSDKSATDAADMLAGLQALEDAVFGNEEDEIEGLVTQVATLTSDLTALGDQVTSLSTALGTLTDKVGNEAMGLIKKVNDIDSTTKEHTTQITELFEKLMWRTLIEE